MMNYVDSVDVVWHRKIIGEHIVKMKMGRYDIDIGLRGCADLKVNEG